MGNMITALMLTDCWSDFEKNPQKFLDTIWEEATSNDGQLGLGAYGGGLKVARYSHADTPRLFFTWRNSLVEMSPYSKETTRLMDQGFEGQLRDYIRICRFELDSLEEELDNSFRTEKGEEK